MESVLSIIYDEDIHIDIDNPHEMLGEVIRSEYTAGRYLHSVKDGQRKEYIHQVE